MPAKKKITYDVEGKKYRKFEDAVAKAVDLSLGRREGIVVIEYGRDTYAITITAQSERIE